MTAKNREIIYNEGWRNEQRTKRDNSLRRQLIFTHEYEDTVAFVGEDLHGFDFKLATACFIRKLRNGKARLCVIYKSKPACLADIEAPDKQHRRDAFLDVVNDACSVYREDALLICFMRVINALTPTDKCASDFVLSTTSLQYRPVILTVGLEAYLVWLANERFPANGEAEHLFTLPKEYLEWKS